MIWYIKIQKIKEQIQKNGIVEIKIDIILNKDRRRKELREWVIGLKSDLECERCGESDWRCLDFHHKDNNKFKSISDMITDGDSKDRILIEIDKCEVVCANCHRKETLNYL